MYGETMSRDRSVRLHRRAFKRWLQRASMGRSRSVHILLRPAKLQHTSADACAVNWSTNAEPACDTYTANNVSSTADA